MIENKEWKYKVLNDSDAPRSLEEIAFILSAGIFGAVLAYSAIRILPACCFVGILPGILFGAVGGAVGAAIGATRQGPYGGVYGALLGSVLGMVTVPIIELVALPIIENAVSMVFLILFVLFPIALTSLG